MKRARAPLPLNQLHASGSLLTTADVARLLRVHPKHVYRLLRRGLPCRRVGGEWRFVADEVLQWSGTARGTGSDEGPAPPEEAPSPTPPPSDPRARASLLAANGDVAVEYLLARLAAPSVSDGEKGAQATGTGWVFGLVQADRGEGLELLKQGNVLAAGCHGSDIPGALEDQRLAFIHLVDRQVGLALRRGVRVRSLRQIGRWKLASRPPTAGVRARFDEELRRNGVDPQAVHSGAVVLSSHRDVVCTVARGEVDVGLASRAWACRVGLDCVPIGHEIYGLLVRASLLGDPRIVRLCEVAQGTAFRREIGAVPGYDARLTGVISYPSRPAHPS